MSAKTEKALDWFMKNTSAPNDVNYQIIRALRILNKIENIDTPRDSLWGEGTEDYDAGRDSGYNECIDELRDIK